MTASHCDLLASVFFPLQPQSPERWSSDQYYQNDDAPAFLGQEMKASNLVLSQVCGRDSDLQGYLYRQAQFRILEPVSCPVVSELDQRWKWVVLRSARTRRRREARSTATNVFRDDPVGVTSEV